MKPLRVLLCVTVLATASYVSAARADSYEKISMDNAVKTLVRFGAIDIKKEEVIDEYGMLTECKLYKKHYNDDFKWNKIRDALRQTIKQNIAIFPTGYYYDAELQLGRYDFKEKQYPFTEKSKIENVNAFTVINQQDSGCQGMGLKFRTTNYRLLLTQPLTICVLPLAEQSAHALLKRIDAGKHRDQIMLTRFNIR